MCIKNVRVCNVIFRVIVGCGKLVKVWFIVYGFIGFLIFVYIVFLVRLRVGKKRIY